MKQIFFLLCCFSVVVFANANTWPREIPLKSGGKITMYEPQAESLSGPLLTGRAAISVREKATDEPIFGAIFMEAKISTDRDSRKADLENFKITNVKVPGLDDTAKVSKLIELLEREIPKWNLEIDVDAIVTQLKAENLNNGQPDFNNKAPKIMYRNKPSTLVLLDGEPKIQQDKALDAERVVNTPGLIFKEGNQWNMYSGGIWYRSSEIKTGWTQNKSLSKKVTEINKQIKKQEKEQNNGEELTTKPEVTDIIIATEPTELIQTNGEPNYKTIAGTMLLYVANTPNELFKDINTQKSYVLLAGRWYTAPQLGEGPWEYVASDKLPADFAKIPEGSEKDAVLANVAGTKAAEEALIDAQIPQTAKVDRKTASIDVKYDGKPQFKKIENTSLELAENSNVTVMRDKDGKYFALENGVWFTSKNAEGPWEVANERPKDVDNIPANSEAYNTKYVYVYDQTPEYVYMGYTPGYMGCYVYGPTIVYGTGWYYRPWYGSIYYPRPVTWGFNFSYNPWTGWSVGIGFNVGFMHFGFYGGGYGGYWGCPGYRPPYRPPYYGGGYYGGNRINTGEVIINGDVNIGSGNRNNIYNNRNGVTTKDVKRGQTRSSANAGVSNRAGTGQPTAQPGVSNRSSNSGVWNNNKGSNTRPATGTSNNVYADRDGNVYRKDDKGNIQQRNNSNRSWSQVNDASRSRDVQRQAENRQRANTRASTYNGGSWSGSRGGGAARPSGGGGMRRR
ncbi:MAG: hypothetical protein MUE99_08785 [Chitinophagaceae bacterium]|nr:hypothetical protein [Chitinophagaceae bacterium]